MCVQSSGSEGKPGSQPVALARPVLSPAPPRQSHRTPVILFLYPRSLKKPLHSLLLLLEHFFERNQRSSFPLNLYFMNQALMDSNFSFGTPRNDVAERARVGPCFQWSFSAAHKALFCLVRNFQARRQWHFTSIKFPFQAQSYPLPFTRYLYIVSFFDLRVQTKAIAYFRIVCILFIPRYAWTSTKCHSRPNSFK